MYNISTFNEFVNDYKDNFYIDDKINDKELQNLLEFLNTKQKAGQNIGDFFNGEKLRIDDERNFFNLRKTIRTKWYWPIYYIENVIFNKDRTSTKYEGNYRMKPLKCTVLFQLLLKLGKLIYDERISSMNDEDKKNAEEEGFTRFKSMIIDGVNSIFDTNNTFEEKEVNYAFGTS
jgi:hypothetical protein